MMEVSSESTEEEFGDTEGPTVPNSTLREEAVGGRLRRAADFDSLIEELETASGQLPCFVPNRDPW